MADNDFPAYELKYCVTSYTRVFGVADYESDVRIMKKRIQDGGFKRMSKIYENCYYIAIVNFAYSIQIS